MGLEFSTILPLHRENSSVYSQFIDFVREMVSIKFDDGRSRAYGVLAPQATTLQAAKAMLFAVEMIDKKVVEGKTVTVELDLYLRMDNLYVIGYSTGQKVFAFSDFENMLENAICLGFDCGYTSLEQGRKRRVQLNVGLQAMKTSVRQLLGHPATEDAKTSLLSLIFHTSEALRFGYISDYILENFEKLDAKIKPDMVDIVNDWGLASKAILDAENSPVETVDSNVIINGKGVKNLEMAKKYVKICLNHLKVSKEDQGKRTTGRGGKRTSQVPQWHNLN